MNADWMEDAACRGVDTELFYPTAYRTGISRRDHESPALNVCQGCEVRTTCLEEALTHNPPEQGVWGGMSEQDRADMRAARKRTA